MTNLRLGLIATLMLAAGCVTQLDSGDEPVASVEQEVKPGCSPRPSHYCEPFIVYATYPSPGPYETGLINCWFRADADLRIGCYGNPAGCCGASGSDPLPPSHSHTNDWSNGVWNCTGTAALKRLCTAGSSEPECQPVCN